MKPLRLPENPRVLVVALRRLGDVLLTTPLIRSVKRAFPQASIDALVFAGTEGILTGNPDLAKVLTLPQRPRAGDTLALMARLCKRYDLALSTQTGDRPTFLAVVAGRQSAGLVEGNGVAAAVKRFALSRSAVSDRDRHRVLDILRLAELIGIPAQAEIVCPGGGVHPALAPAQPYAVIHAAPMFTYKRWTGAGWRALAAALHERGLATAVTGAVSDRAYLDDVWRDSKVVRLDGRLDWPELTALIARRARLYRAGHRHHPPRRGDWHPDGRALWPDRSAAVGTVAAWRSRSPLGRRRHHPASRQCLAGAKSAAMPAVPVGRLRAPARQPQPMSR